MADDIKSGDRFLVEVEVTGEPVYGPYPVKIAGSIVESPLVSRGVLLAAKRLPRALKVGDRVRRHYGPCASAFGVILAIHANKAWIDLGDQTTVWLLADLTPAEDAP